MKISPEPLSPLRNWRELWQPEPMGYEPAFRQQTTVNAGAWKEKKNTSSTWFSHLFGRTTQR